MKLYVLVRGDLSKSQQAVQAGHAIAEWCRQGYYSNWDGVLIYLKVRDEKELKNYYKEAAEDRAGFWETYWGSSLTAFAVLGEDGKYEKLKMV